jgi:hypothetical protein
VINLSVKAAKGGFFDRGKVIAAMDRATRKASVQIRQFCSATRQDLHPQAQGHLAPRRAALLAPGQYPQVPVLLLRRRPGNPSSSAPRGWAGRSTRRALPALEYGGTSTGISKGKRRSISVRARPFMGPAFEAERPGLAAMWRDSVK